jgi:hypothetical protein
MAKQIIDQQTGATVTIDLIGNIATICANGILLTQTINRADLSMAKVALAKRDLEGFGSFFNTETERIAA